MADTGAPWNIPYVEPADLVRAYPAADEAQALAIAAGLSAAGVIKQVVQTVKTDSFTTTNTSYTAVTGYTATITPEANTHKILILASFVFGIDSGTADHGGHARLTGGNAGTYIGDAASSRERAANSRTITFGTGRAPGPSTLIYLDSPNTTSPVTYGLEIRRQLGTLVFFGRSGIDTNNANFGRTPASLTLIEVQA